MMGGLKLWFSKIERMKPNFFFFKLGTKSKIIKVKGPSNRGYDQSKIILLVSFVQYIKFNEIISY